MTHQREGGQPAPSFAPAAYLMADEAERTQLRLEVPHHHHVILTARHLRAATTTQTVRSRAVHPQTAARFRRPYQLLEVAVPGYTGHCSFVPTEAALQGRVQSVQIAHASCTREGKKNGRTFEIQTIYALNTLYNSKMALQTRLNMGAAAAGPLVLVPLDLQLGLQCSSLLPRGSSG